MTPKTTFNIDTFDYFYACVMVGLEESADSDCYPQDRKIITTFVREQYPEQDEDTLHLIEDALTFVTITSLDHMATLLDLYQREDPDSDPDDILAHILEMKGLVEKFRGYISNH